jgi:CheY-like chemotaxis protein
MAVVLIVDDEFGIAKLLEDVFQDEGHRTISAANGKQALERIIAERPDLIITDLMMPVMDGPAFLRALSANPANETIPVVIMSSLPEATVQQRCPHYALFLRKPFKIFDAVRKITEILNGKVVSSP